MSWSEQPPFNKYDVVRFVGPPINVLIACEFYIVQDWSWSEINQQFLVYLDTPKGVRVMLWEDDLEFIAQDCLKDLCPQEH